MTAFYSQQEFRKMSQDAQARGDASYDLVLCSDGIMRTEAEAHEFEMRRQAEISMKQFGF